MKFERAAGILLHPTSLPGPFGVGDFGPAAYHWLDWLAGSNTKLWQVLPLGPTGYGDSPYQCFSAFAGNPYLISPELLLEDRLLTEEDLQDMPGWDERCVDYGRLYQWKPGLLEKAFNHFVTNPPVKPGTGQLPLRSEFDIFCRDNGYWLEDYSLFMSIKEHQGGGPWVDWPKPLRLREAGAVEAIRQSLADSIARYKFVQFLFFRQWSSLKVYARELGISIIGDMPIFVAIDSADVWAHPDLFYLNEESRPTVVAGVPPDYFSPTGQLWGNPLYRWEVHQAKGYSWWLERIKSTLKLVDIVRIDHFRGFAGYWEIPAGNSTAEVGRWVPGPGQDLFNVIENNLGTLPILAEDLGVITPDVVELREKFGLPGMKILQFAFSGPDNSFLPHNLPRNCAVYTGTHDNDTSMGWYESAPEEEKDFARRYLGVDGNDFAWDLIRAGWRSVSLFALAPMQDFLSLGTEARMNYPSRLGGNWQWRLVEADLSDSLQARLKEMNWLYLR